MTINPGIRVTARTADGQDLPRRAVSDVVEGEDFPVVWITTEDEWLTAKANGTEPEAWPWPAEDVQPSEGAVAA